MTTKELDTLPTIFKDTHLYNVESFTNYGLVLLTTLTGGADSQIFENYMKIFVVVCVPILIIISMCGGIQKQTGTAFDVCEFLDKAKMAYRGMKHLGICIFFDSSTSVIPRINRYDKDIAVLLATSKSLAKHISKLTTSVAKVKETNKYFLSLTGNDTSLKLRVTH